MREEKILKRILEENRFKITTPRLTVFHLLLNKDPQSIPNLIRRSEGRVNRVSVYRVIDLFEKLGIARRVNIGWKYKIELSEIFLDHHHHITCLVCNEIVAVQENEEIEQVINRLGEDNNFTISSHQLELQGYCKKCQLQNSAARR